MATPEISSGPAEQPVLTLIQQIKDGTVKPTALNKEQRQQCVEVLALEGYTTSHIAQILDRSEKTIRRDLADIRVRNALAPTPELAKQLIGNLLMKSEVHQAALMRLARAKDGAVAERAQAEYLAWKIVKETTEALQSLGYLPLRPQQVVGNFVHHLSGEDSESSLERIEETILEIGTVAKDTGTLTPALTEHLQALELRLEQAKLNHEAQRLLEQQRQAPEEKETPDVR